MSYINEYGYISSLTACYYRKFYSMFGGPMQGIVGSDEELLSDDTVA